MDASSVKAVISHLNRRVGSTMMRCIRSNMPALSLTKSRILILGLPFYALVSLYFAISFVRSEFVFLIDPPVYLFSVGGSLILSQDYPSPLVRMIMGVSVFVLFHIIFWTPISLLIIRLMEKRDHKKHKPLVSVAHLSNTKKLALVACAAVCTVALAQYVFF